MRAREFIDSRLAGFFEYLKAIGIEPSSFRTDQLINLALMVEYGRYAQMMAAWQEAQKKDREEREARLEEVKLVSVWDGGVTLESNAKLDPVTGEVSDIDLHEGVDGLEVLDEQYVVRLDGTKLPVVQDEGGRYRVEVQPPKEEANSEAEVRSD